MRWSYWWYLVAAILFMAGIWITIKGIDYYRFHSPWPPIASGIFIIVGIAVIIFGASIVAILNRQQKDDEIAPWLNYHEDDEIKTKSSFFEPPNLDSWLIPIGEVERNLPPCPRCKPITSPESEFLTRLGKEKYQCRDCGWKVNSP